MFADADGVNLMLASLFVIYGSKLFSIVFILMDDVFRVFKWSKKKVFSTKEVAEHAHNITRSEFLMKTALLAASIPAVTLTWGIISGAHDYRKRHVRLVIKNLPKAFEGIMIGQISDIHSGSFFNKVAVKGGVEMLSGVEMLIRAKPDIVFFTGDLVNDRASEVREYIDLFSTVKAPLGVYSTFGNHDYGAYKCWPGPHAKNQNLNDVKLAHKIMGYDLLVDEHRVITLDGEKLAVIGVQNISATESISRTTATSPKPSRVPMRQL